MYNIVLLKTKKKNCIFHNRFQTQSSSTCMYSPSTFLCVIFFSIFSLFSIPISWSILLHLFFTCVFVCLFVFFGGVVWISFYFMVLVIPFKFLRVMVFFVGFFFTHSYKLICFSFYSPFVRLSGALFFFVSKVKVCLAKIYATKKRRRQLTRPANKKWYLHRNRNLEGGKHWGGELN